MNIQTITKMLIESGIEPNEAKTEVKMLLGHFCKFTEKDRLMGREPENLEIVESKVRERIKTRIPVQYLIGEAYFMGEFFKVTPDVLIPRDETEILVRRAIEIIRGRGKCKGLDGLSLPFEGGLGWVLIKSSFYGRIFSSPRPSVGEGARRAGEGVNAPSPDGVVNGEGCGEVNITPSLDGEGRGEVKGKCIGDYTVLDIGTGSGCIACTIAKNTDATVLGIDISSDALRVALDNVTKLGINNRAVFRKSDLFERIREDEKFDMIISNPPYIPTDYEFEPEVLHEPKIALIAGENGLEFYRRITERAPEFLKPEGVLMFELGIGEAEAVKALMERDFKDIRIEKDLAGIERIIYGTRR